ncbi:DNRLRE domain-containing protein, partial [Candidatus Aerophobetes bacterium]|nr:DNRLRE domain-containing protein [Candidatus Aerophobetes bacterium]
IYYDPGYLEDFDTSKKAIAALAYGGCKVEGVQTTFLRELYGNFVKTSPARVFGDYLRIMDSFKEESWVLRWIPARNIGEWVKMKKKNKGIEEGNLNALAKKFRITECDTGITVYAQGNLTIKINKNSYQLQEGVNGIVSLTPGEAIQIKGGAGLIYINDPKGSKTTYLFVKKGTSFQFLSFKEVKVMQGEVAFYGPIVIHTPIATIQPKGTSGVVKVKTNGEVKIQIVEGKVDVETPTDKKELFEGQETLIEKEGKIGLVQPIDQKEIIESFYQDILTSGKTTEESTRVSQDDEEKWRWSDPEGNDHYSIQKGRFYLKINPYQDIWYCNRGGAGLLTTDVPEGDNWSAEVKLHLIKREAATHAGLVIWNGKEKPPVYALYIGLYDTERIRIEGSYSKTCTGWSSTLKGIKENKGNFDEAYKSDTVYLKIEKEKYSYRFYYRPPDSKDWRMLGQIFTRDKFTRIGFIGKSWGGNSLEAIFTDFKLYTSRVPGVFPAGKAPAGTTPKNIIKLYPSADSHVFAYSYRNWNNANWGRWEIIGAGWQIPGGEKRAYLKFDLPKVSCKKATLKLYLYNIGGSNSVALGVYRVVEPWSEGTGTYHSGQVEKRAEEGEITWNNQPSFDPRPVAVFRPPEKVNRWVSVDITPLVKMWLSGNPNYGLMIKMVENPHPGLAESIYNFRSREYKDKTKWPFLEIETSRSEKTEVSSIIASVQGSVTLVEKQSKFDFAGRDEKLKGDGRPDTHFRLTLNAPGRSIKWLEIHSTKGRFSAWDTKPDNGMWLIVVAYDGIILNHSDGSFQVILPEGEKVFDLYLQDNGSIAAGYTSYRLTIGFSNGKECSFPVVTSLSYKTR